MIKVEKGNAKRRAFQRPSFDSEVFFSSFHCFWLLEQLVSNEDQIMTNWNQVHFSPLPFFRDVWLSILFQVWKLFLRILSEFAQSREKKKVFFSYFFSIDWSPFWPVLTLFCSLKSHFKLVAEGERGSRWLWSQVDSHPKGVERLEKFSLNLGEEVVQQQRF